MAGDSFRKRRCTASLESSLGGAARVSSGAEHTKKHIYYQGCGSGSGSAFFVEDGSGSASRSALFFEAGSGSTFLLSVFTDPDSHYFWKLDPDPHSYYQGCGSGFALFLEAGSGSTFLLPVPGLRIRNILGSWIRIRIKVKVQKLLRLQIEPWTLTMKVPRGSKWSTGGSIL